LHEPPILIPPIPPMLPVAEGMLMAVPVGAIPAMPDIPDMAAEVGAIAML
jgi:hypothetical protein